MRRRCLACLVTFVLLAAGLTSLRYGTAWAGGSAGEPPEARELPSIILPDVAALGFTAGAPLAPGHYVPESIQYHDGAFFQGNIPTGEILRVEPDGSSRVILPAKSSPLQQSVFGLRLDRVRSILNIASAKFPSDINAPVQSAYLAIHVPDGRIVRAVDLSHVAPNFNHPRRANDLCFFASDNPFPDIFITDSNSAQIWKVDQHNNVTTLATDARFNANPADTFFNPLQIGLNGVACNADGFLLTVRFGSADNSNLFRVDLDGTVTEVPIVQGRNLFEVADDIFFEDRKTLIVTENEPPPRVSHVAKLVTDDGWRTARLVERVDVPLPKGTPPPSGTDRAGCVRGSSGVFVGDDLFVNCFFTASIVKLADFGR